MERGTEYQGKMKSEERREGRNESLGGTEQDSGAGANVAGGVDCG